MDYALDTNTVIHLMRGTKSAESSIERARSNGARFFIPYAVHYEVRRGLIIKPIPKYEKAYAIICANCSIQSITDEVWERAARIYAELYAKRFTVADADILIAAFCVLNDYTLVTDNKKDFENIDGLKFENWITP